MFFFAFNVIETGKIIFLHFKTTITYIKYTFEEIVVLYFFHKEHKELYLI